MKMEVLLSILFLVFTQIYIAQAQADLATPDYEIKFYMKNEQVLDSFTDKLKQPVQDYFLTDKKYTIVMEFLDSDSQDLYSKGWIVRIRNVQNKPKLDISYKYRIPIVTTIKSALEEAASLGWDSSETDYEYQVEWGYSKQTLSITNSKENVDLPGVDEEAMELPSGDTARKAVIDRLPGKLKNWGEVHYGIKNWASDILKNAHTYGPVGGKRYVGVWNSKNKESIKVYIEVWDIAGTILVELSFKVDTYENAEALHQEMKNLLDIKGWLTEKDILKTQMIFDAYKPLR